MLLQGSIRILALTLPLGLSKDESAPSAVSVSVSISYGIGEFVPEKSSVIILAPPQNTSLFHVGTPKTNHASIDLFTGALSVIKVTDPNRLSDTIIIS